MNGETPCARPALEALSIERWNVQETRDRDLILGILNRDRLFAAYAIGDLEPTLFAECTWVVARCGESHGALALLFRGLNPPALLLYGEPIGNAAILKKAPHPDEIYAVIKEKHLSALQLYYTVDTPKRMLRMAWVARTLPETNPAVFRLTSSDLLDLSALEALHDESAFSPYQLEQGVFFGVRVDGRLVAVAGTHLVAPAQGVAAIGNVFTHPSHRGQGYARECTAAVLRELAGKASTIVLNVGAENRAAQHVYEKLGFVRHCEYLEVMAHRSQ
jgi:ribosomal protein S18 acetylase RimI-like enzyme